MRLEGMRARIVARRLLTHLSEREVIDCLYELPPLTPNVDEASDMEAGPV
jgi:hypothetical protein